MRHPQSPLPSRGFAHLCTIAAALSLTGCADKGGDSGSPSTPAPSFAKVRDEVLVQSCGFGSCHGSGVGGLQLDAEMTLDALVDAPSTVLTDEVLVIAGDPDGSYLIAKMEDASGIEGAVMPPSGALTEERIAIVRDWIAAGAPE